MFTWVKVTGGTRSRSSSLEEVAPSIYSLYTLQKTSTVAPTWFTLFPDCKSTISDIRKWHILQNPSAFMPICTPECQVLTGPHFQSRVSSLKGTTGLLPNPNMNTYPAFHSHTKQLTVKKTTSCFPPSLSVTCIVLSKAKTFYFSATIIRFCEVTLIDLGHFFLAVNLSSTNT